MSLKKIVFVGYSMPEADVHIKAILSRAGTNEKELTVINPFIDEAGKNRYRQLNAKVKFIEKTFTEALDDGDVKAILQKPKIIARKINKIVNPLALSAWLHIQNRDSTVTFPRCLTLESV